MENIVWSCTFSQDTVVIEPQLYRYFGICEYRRCANKEVRVRGGYQIITIDGNECVNVTAGMKVSKPGAAERAVKSLTGAY